MSHQNMPVFPRHIWHAFMRLPCHQTLRAGLHYQAKTPTQSAHANSAAGLVIQTSSQARTQVRPTPKGAMNSLKVCAQPAPPTPPSRCFSHGVSVVWTAAVMLQASGGIDAAPRLQLS